LDTSQRFHNAAPIAPKANGNAESLTARTQDGCPPFFCLCLSDSHYDALSDKQNGVGFQRSGLRSIDAELRAELVDVVGEKRCIMAGAEIES